jgi:glutathione synthase/RimK-type ligase-like ATP-grasp enzyme
MKIRIDPYNNRSSGAKLLGQRTGILRVTPKQMEKHNARFDCIINWGNTEEYDYGKPRYINAPSAVRRAVDKKASFLRLQEEGVPIPPFTDEKACAVQWLQDGNSVVARKLLRGSKGRGIVLCSPRDGVIDYDKELPNAPLYVQYVKKQDEYRVHVVNGSIIDVQQKKKRQEVDNDEVNYQVRNAHNGWVFCRDGVVAPECVLEAGVAAVVALNLDFGAVDIGFNAHTQSACVYEVNTAPGLEGTTLERYYAAFTEVLPVLQGGAYRRRRMAEVQI